MPLNNIEKNLKLMQDKGSVANEGVVIRTPQSQELDLLAEANKVAAAEGRVPDTSKDNVSEIMKKLLEKAMTEEAEASIEQKEDKIYFGSTGDDLYYASIERDEAGQILNIKLYDVADELVSEHPRQGEEGNAEMVYDVVQQMNMDSISFKMLSDMNLLKKDEEEKPAEEVPAGEQKPEGEQPAEETPAEEAPEAEAPGVEGADVGEQPRESIKEWKEVKDTIDRLHKGERVFAKVEDKFVEIKTPEDAMKYEKNQHYVKESKKELAAAAERTKSALSMLRKIHKADAIDKMDAIMDALEKAATKGDIDDKQEARLKDAWKRRKEILEKNPKAPEAEPTKEEEKDVEASVEEGIGLSPKKGAMAGNTPKERIENLAKELQAENDETSKKDALDIIKALKAIEAGKRAAEDIIRDMDTAVRDTFIDYYTKNGKDKPALAKIRKALPGWGIYEMCEAKEKEYNDALAALLKELEDKKITQAEYLVKAEELKAKHEAEQQGAPEVTLPKGAEKREKDGAIKKESVLEKKTIGGIVIKIGNGEADLVASMQDAADKLENAGKKEIDTDVEIWWADNGAEYVRDFTPEETKQLNGFIGKGVKEAQATAGKFAEKIKKARENWEKDFPNVIADADDIANDVAVMIEEEGGTVTKEDYEAILKEVEGKAGESVKEAQQGIPEALKALAEDSKQYGTYEEFSKTIVTVEDVQRAVGKLRESLKASDVKDIVKDVLIGGVLAENGYTRVFVDLVVDVTENALPAEERGKEETIERLASKVHLGAEDLMRALSEKGFISENPEEDIGKIHLTVRAGNTAYEVMEDYGGVWVEQIDDAEKIIAESAESAKTFKARYGMDVQELYNKAKVAKESVLEEQDPDEYKPTKREMDAFFAECTRKPFSWDNNEIKASKDPVVHGFAKNLIVIPSTVLWNNPPEYPMQEFDSDAPRWFVLKHNDKWYLVDTEGYSYIRYAVELVGFNKSDSSESLAEAAKKWIQKAFAKAKRKGTTGKCTGSKFGGPTCPAGSKRYNMAKNLRKMSKARESILKENEATKDELIAAIKDMKEGDTVYLNRADRLVDLWKGKYIYNDQGTEEQFDDVGDLLKRIGLTEGKVPDVSKDDTEKIIKDLLEKHGLGEGGHNG